LVRELVDRGHEVVYYATDASSVRIERAHARYLPYRNAFLADMTHLPERLEQLSWLLMRTTAEVLDEQSHVTGDSDLPRVFIRFWSDTAI